MNTTAQFNSESKFQGTFKLNENAAGDIWLQNGDILVCKFESHITRDEALEIVGELNTQCV